MKQQGLLIAGPLYGSLIFHDIDEKYITALDSDNLDSQNEYSKRLGKEIANQIYQSVSNFIHIVRTKYGQYWVHEIQKWDSRQESLTNYCKCLYLKWKIEESEVWKDFFPDPPGTPSHSIILSRAPVRFEDYISHDDWQDIQTTLGESSNQTTSEKLFIRAQKNEARGDLKWALIDSVTVLEISLDDFIRNRFSFITQSNKSKTLESKLEKLLTLDLPTKTTMIASLAHDNSSKRIEDILKGIEIRNELVHEGKELPDCTLRCLNAILKFVGSLLPLSCHRFPSPRPGNMLYE